MGSKKRWNAGELADDTGVSVRALHYYEEIGLLIPSARSRAGQRLYGVDDVAKLHQIVALRDLRFSLGQIAEMLASPDSSPLAVIQLHLEHLRGEVSQRQVLCQKLEVLADTLEQHGRASAGHFLEALRWTTLIDEYYSSDHLEFLAEQPDMFSEEEIERVQDEWREVFARMREAMDAGLDPADESVQALVDRMSDLVEMFTGGDEGVRATLAEMWTDDQQPHHVVGVDRELSAYMERARDAHH